MRLRNVAAVLGVVVAAGAAWLVLRWQAEPSAPSLPSRPPAAQADQAAATEPVHRERVRTAGRDEDDAEPADEDDDAPVRIFGRVVDDEVEGVPYAGVADATVTLLARPRSLLQTVGDDNMPFVLDAASEVLAETTTDAEGRFSLPGEHRPSAVVVRVAAEGYVPAQVASDELDDELTLYVARPELQLRFRVVDAADVPVASAVALLYTEVNEPACAAAHADEDGRVELAFAEGELVVRAPGFAPAHLTTPSDYQDRTVVLRTGTTISGVVCDASGRGIAGAVVCLDWVPVPPVATDAEGRFRMEHVPETEDYVDLVAQARGRLTSSESARPGATDVRIELQLPARISGVVVDENGRTVAGAQLRSPGGAYVYRLGATDASGRFDVRDVRAGELRLQATLETKPEGGALEFAIPGLRGEVTVRAEPGAHLDGVRIVVAPAPVSFVCYRVLDADGTPLDVQGTIEGDVEGNLGGHVGVRTTAEITWRWIRALVPPGTDVSLTVNPVDRDGQVRSQVFTVTTSATPDGPPAVLRLQPIEEPLRAVLTLVTTRADGRPIGADDYVAWQCRCAGRNSFARRGAGPGATGHCEVPPGRAVTVMASAEGCGTRTFTVPALTEDSTFTCVLPPESVVSGRLVSASGTPIGRAYGTATVTLADGTESVSEFWFEQLGADGVFELPQLASGRCRVLIFGDDDRVRAYRELDLREGARVDLGDVVVDRLPLLRGTVVVDGVPTGGIGVQVYAGDTSLGRTSSRPDGTFALPVIPEAEGEIFVEDDSGSVLYDLGAARATSPVQLVAGLGDEVTLTLAGGVEDDSWTLETTCRLASGVRLFPDDSPTGDVITLYSLPRATVEVVVRAVDDETGTVHATWRGTVTPRAEPQEVALERER